MNKKFMSFVVYVYSTILEKLFISIYKPTFAVKNGLNN